MVDSDWNCSHARKYQESWRNEDTTSSRWIIAKSFWKWAIENLVFVFGDACLYLVENVDWYSQIYRLNAIWFTSQIRNFTEFANCFREAVTIFGLGFNNNNALPKRVTFRNDLLQLSFVTSVDKPDLPITNKRSRYI